MDISHTDFFFADLHIHSRFSLATSPRLSLPLLRGWAAQKGLAVLGTGDFTHPVWRAEMEKELQPFEDTGLFSLKTPLPVEKIPALARHTPPCPEPLFMLQAEVSSIYKEGGKTRKVHNLLYAPDFATASAISARLEAWGKLASDGRPILKLSCRDLMELVKEVSPHAYLIPAHIWTPWFSVFGSKSGYDSLEEVFGNMRPYVFALETGLSSDPTMNRRFHNLDTCRLVSNSDAHSCETLAREATVFAGLPSYHGIFTALQQPPSLPFEEDSSRTRHWGTVEFFPQEGKYYHDGHRACDVNFSPAESMVHGNTCPACGKPLTLGVLHRVEELAARSPHPGPSLTENVLSLVPLIQILAETLHTRPQNKKTQVVYKNLTSALGPELDILTHIPLEHIAAVMPETAWRIHHMRTGRLRLIPGYDGEYGKVFWEKGE